MSNDNALYEDDFASDFEDVFADDPLADELGEIVANDEPTLDASVDLNAPQKQVEPAETLEMPLAEGGDRQLPAIAIKAFYEREETHELVETIGRDRRLGRATVDPMPGGIPAAIAWMQDHPTPNLLLIESAAPMAQMLSQIDELAGFCDEGVQVMVMGATNDIMLYRQLMARGVSEYLVPPIQPLQLIRSISALFTDPDAPFVGRQISVVGAKGGVGASTIAHNLAWSLSENAGVNTTLVDLDLSFGTTALDFNQDTPQTVADALLAPERTDDAVIARLLAKATERLSLFTAPANIGSVLDFPPEAYTAVIEGVRRNTPYVVLDLPHVWSTWLEQTLVSSDEVIIVCQPDLASLRNGKNIIDQMKAQRVNDTEPRLVLNMSGVPKRPEIPVKDFSAAIGVEPEIILPFEPELFGTAANNGQMISETDPLSKSSMAIDHMSAILTGRRVEQPRKSLLKKILGK